MRRPRLLALLGVAIALVVGSITAAEFDQAISPGSFGQSASDAIGLQHGRDAVTPAVRQIRDFGSALVRGSRGDSHRHVARDGAALLAAGLVVLALRRRAHATVAGTNSSLWHGTIPLGRGPPALVAS